MLAPLSADPTKCQEIAHYSDFLAQLPRGCYLASILEGTGPIVEGYIRNDFALPALRESIADREAAQAEALAARKMRDDIQEQAREACRALESAKRELAHYKRELESIQARAAKLAEGSY